MAAKARHEDLEASWAACKAKLESAKQLSTTQASELHVIQETCHVRFKSQFNMGGIYLLYVCLCRMLDTVCARTLEATSLVALPCV